MRKSIMKVLATTLVVTMLVPSIVVPTSRVSAYTISKDGPIKYIKEVSPEGIAKLNEIAIESDLEMLDDIVERSYNNNFDIKSYVIKSTDNWLDSAHWRNYLYSRGDIKMKGSFTRNNIVHYVDENGTDWYYHSVSVKVTPEFDYFDYETRKVENWDDYISRVREAERQIGYVEGGNLCDYELLWGVYCWMAEHIQYGAVDAKTGGQTAVDAVRYGEAVCAGYARLLNRFCHDFGIDSYWASIPSMDHAVNFVKLNNEYYHVDFNCANFDKNYDYSPGDISFYFFNRFYALKDKNITLEADYYEESKSILYYYNSEDKFVNSKHSLESVEVYPTVGDNYFYQPGPKAVAAEDVVEYDDTTTCGHCNQRHYFPWSETSTVLVKEYPTIEHSYSFEGTEDSMNWYDNYTQGAFTIYRDGNPIHTEVNEVETTTEYTTEEPTTVEPTTVEPTTEEEVPTPPTRPIETTNNNNVPTTPPVVVVEPSTNAPSNKPLETTSAKINDEPTTKEVTTKETEPTTKTTVKPSKAKKLTAKNNKKKSIKLTWKKATNAKKYQIQYSTSKKFKKKVVTKTTKKLKYTIKKLAKGKTYYIRVRGINGKEVGKWSKVKKVKISK